MSIPKIIHYCWFGGGALPELAQNCIASWKKFCPDYEIKCWNEENFDLNSHPYMQEAAKMKKWAFVSDLARLMVVHQYGGIYLDVDIELVKPLDDLLQYDAYFGFEGSCINTGLGFGAAAGNAFVKALLDDYAGVRFITANGGVDEQTCPVRNTRVLKQRGLKCDGSFQVIEQTVFLPEEYLCPLDSGKKNLNITENTISIHHYMASWRNGLDWKVRRSLEPIFGGQFGYLAGRAILRLDIILKKMRKIL